jgi:hypothetical protein
MRKFIPPGGRKLTRSRMRKKREKWLGWHGGKVDLTDADLAVFRTVFSFTFPAGAEFFCETE